MCLCLRNHHIRDPRPRYESDWQPNVTYYGGKRRASFHTSRTEVTHLLAAIVLLSISFALLMGGIMLDAGGLRSSGRGAFGLESMPFLTVLWISAIATGSGFLLHELMHKFVAQYYGHWAEFRAQTFGLLLPIPLVLFFGFIFAAPGAVIISGFVKKHENGIISVAGPMTNVVIAMIAYPFTIIPGTVDTIMFNLATVTMLVNGILAVFNMLPFGPLDGKKVWAWNKPLYAVVMIIALGTVFLAIYQ